MSARVATVWGGLIGGAARIPYANTYTRQNILWHRLSKLFKLCGMHALLSRSNGLQLAGSSHSTLLYASDVRVVRCDLNIQANILTSCLYSSDARR